MGAGPAKAVVIDFDALPPGTFFSGTYTEDGYTLAFTDMDCGSGSTSTPPGEIERAKGRSGTLTATRTGGGTFTFDSVDWERGYGASAAISLEG